MYKLVKEVEGAKKGTGAEISVPDPENKSGGNVYVWTENKGWYIFISKTNKSQIRLAWIAVILSAIWILWFTLDHEVTTFIRTANLDKKDLTFVLTDELASPCMFDSCLHYQDMIFAFLVAIQWMYLALSVLLVAELTTNPFTNLNLWFAMKIAILVLICIVSLSVPLLRCISLFWVSFLVVIQIYLGILWVTITHINAKMKYLSPGCATIA